MKRTVILAALLMAAVRVLANGDPVAESSALTLARTPVAVHIPEVKLLDERCRFTLRDGYVDVEVRYLLQNQSAKEFRQLPYGFPVDWLGEGAAHWEGLNIYSESIAERGWRDSYVRDVMFNLNGRSLSWQCSADTMLRRRSAYYEPFSIKEMLWDIDTSLPESDPLFRPDSLDHYYTAARERKLVAKYGKSVLPYADPIYRRWYYVRLDIPAGQTVELKVRYRIETKCERSLGVGQRVFSACESLWCDFRYDFSPAAYWGDGHAQRFSVEVDTANVIRFHSPYDYEPVEVKGLPLQKKGHSLCYETRNFDLAAAEPLEIGYVTGLVHEDVADLLGRRIAPDRYTVTLSGVDPKYPAANLSDMDLATAAVLRPDKRDSLYITITFRDSVMLTGVLLYNGYCKDRQTWLNNSRIDTLDYRYATRALTWDDTLASEEVEVKIFFPETNWCEELQGSEPSDFTWQGLTDAAIKLPVETKDMNYSWERAYNRQKTKQITIRIQAVAPGLKYNDLCVSEIILLGD